MWVDSLHRTHGLKDNQVSVQNTVEKANAGPRPTGILIFGCRACFCCMLMVFIIFFLLVILAIKLL
ncbi:hypothetical protein QJS04_geneDACA016510 [Acorus gramineus]|uniref:Uncharacterized protein n=1 Tax=Acorus gramineus TaxID=55184 RepID=A0AAV9BDB6_ACOGR|nr:hypothetical protein QJS04_geneDACA016510 [Acorus gramineus]